MQYFFIKRPLINTPLQRGGRANGRDLNPFSGFQLAEEPCVLLETAKAVPSLTALTFTPLKRLLMRVTVEGTGF